MPATSTPYDNEIIGITKSDDENIVKTIKLKFKKTGVIPKMLHWSRYRCDGGEGNRRSADVCEGKSCTPNR